MAFPEVMGVLNNLSTSVEAMAAIGAYLALDDNADGRTRAALADVVKAAGIDDIDSLQPQERAMAQNFVQLFFRLADELLASPDRPPGWTYTDPVVLEGMGRASGMLPPLMAQHVPGIGEVNSFLDVGTGVGWLAISAANVWPAARVVGLDIWDPAIDRARQHVAESGLEERVEIRKQDVTTFDEPETYDGAWLPSFFFNEEIREQATRRVVDALKPGGWIVVGRFTSPEDPLARATETLRTFRGGGALLGVEETGQLLREAGCREVVPVERSWPLPVDFVVGRKPA